MSEEEEPIEVRRQLPGEWWYFAGQLRMALGHRKNDPDWEWINQPDAPSGCIIHIGPRMTRQHHTSFVFMGKEDSTTLVVHTRTRRLPDVQPLIDDLETMAREAREARRSSRGETPDELIAYYYRSRAAGGKVTLKQLAQQAGISYSYITKEKMKYDRAGKWGSRSERNSES